MEYAIICQLRFKFSSFFIYFYSKWCMPSTILSTTTNPFKICMLSLFSEFITIHSKCILSVTFFFLSWHLSLTTQTVESIYLNLTDISLNMLFNTFCLKGENIILQFDNYCVLLVDFYWLPFINSRWNFLWCSFAIQHCCLSFPILLLVHFTIWFCFASVLILSPWRFLIVSIWTFTFSYMVPAILLFLRFQNSKLHTCRTWKSLFVSLF